MARVFASVVLLAAGCARPAPAVERITATATPMSRETPEATHEALTPTPVVRPVVAPLKPAAGAAGPSGDRVHMSWYTMGTRTASGEPVQPHALNCAGARRWRLGDSVTIRNPENDRRATVRINDRGAFERMGRALDCMVAVWHALGIPLSRGVATVEVLA